MIFFKNTILFFISTLLHKIRPYFDGLLYTQTKASSLTFPPCHDILNLQIQMLLTQKTQEVESMHQLFAAAKFRPVSALFSHGVALVPSARLY